MKKTLWIIVICLLALCVTPIALAGDAVSYLGANGLATVTEYTVITADTTAWTTGTYVAAGEVTLSSRVNISGTVDLILCDGASLVCSEGINCGQNETLNIYAQSTGASMGSLSAIGGYEQAGIGSNGGGTSGHISIYGGSITAEGGQYAAGIGGGSMGRNLETRIYGGHVVARAGLNGAGIGGGSNYKWAGSYGHNVLTVISGGVVEAYGDGNGAGIGGGGCGNLQAGAAGQLIINGGQVTMTGGANGAGFGAGRSSNSENNGAAGTASISWTSETDFVQASSWEGAVILEKDFADGDNPGIVFHAGEVVDLATISGMKLSAIFSGYTIGVSSNHGAVETGFLADGVLTPQSSAFADDMVTVRVTPDSGWLLSSLKLSYGSVTQDLPCTHRADGVEESSFTMPDANVTVTASFVSSQYQDWVNGSLASASIPADAVFLAADSLAWSGCVVVRGSLTIQSRVVTEADTKLILLDGSTLYVPLGITVNKGCDLTICAQSTGNARGTLKVDAPSENCAGIGSDNSHSSGLITILGGFVDVVSNTYGAGIGGGAGQTGEIVVRGGYVRAETDGYGAAVGGGNQAAGTVTVIEGILCGKSTGYGAGIGGGKYGTGYVTISGGSVVGETYMVTNSGDRGTGAGIGGGGVANGIVTITGGYVSGTANSMGASIGGGAGTVQGTVVTITGGSVVGRAYGTGAAIGSGIFNEGTCIILGWEVANAGNPPLSVTATGNNRAPGFDGSLTMNKPFRKEGEDVIFHSGDVLNTSALNGMKLVPYEGREYLLDCSCKNGMIRPTYDGETTGDRYFEGEEIIVLAEPDPGFYLDSLTLRGDTTEDVRTFNASDPAPEQVNFHMPGESVILDGHFKAIHAVVCFKDGTQDFLTGMVDDNGDAISNEDLTSLSDGWYRFTFSQPVDLVKSSEDINDQFSYGAGWFQYSIHLSQGDDILFTRPNENDLYTLTYMDADGTELLVTTERKGREPYLYWPSRTGYVLDGWADGNGRVVTIGDSYMPNEDTVLTAQWTALTSYEISTDGRVTACDANGDPISFYYEGMRVWIRPSDDFTPPSGMYFMSYTLDGEPISGDCFNMPAKAVEVGMALGRQTPILIDLSAAQLGDTLSVDDRDITTLTDYVTEELTGNDGAGALFDLNGDGTNDLKYWYSGSDSSGGTLTILDGAAAMNRNITAASFGCPHIVTWAFVSTYSVTVTESGQGGTASAHPAFAAPGEIVTIETETENSVYSLESLTATCGGVPVEIATDYTFVMQEGDVTVTAVFYMGGAWDTFNWRIDEGVLTFTGSGAMKADSSGNYPWVPVKDVITSAVIGEGITSVAEKALQRCKNMTAVVLPDSLTDIGNAALAECETLTAIDLPAGLETIGASAMCNCTSLGSVTIPSGVETVPTSAFLGCTAMTSVTFENGITSLESNAFYGCSSLKKVVLPDTVTTLGTTVFYNCTALESVTLSSNLTKMGDAVFYGCKALSSIVLPQSLTQIGSTVFYGCEKITAIVLPDGIQSASGTIYGLNNLTDLTCSADILSSCSHMSPKLARLTVTPGRTGVITSGACYNVNSLETLTIKPGVTQIQSGAFQQCTKLQQITLSEGLVSLGSGAFQSCIALTRVNMPATLETIDPAAFQYCTALAEVTMPGVKQIGSQAFYQTALTDLVLPETIEILSSGAFVGCQSLVSVTINGPCAIGDNAFVNCDSIQTVYLSASIKSIGYAAFASCDALTDIWFSGTQDEWDAVARNEEWLAGFDAEHMPTLHIAVPVFGQATFTLPNALTTIEASAFEGNTFITIVDAHNCKSIGAGAFQGCTGLTQIRVHQDCQIDNTAFTGCGTVYVFAPAGGDTETWCEGRTDIVFVPEAQN